ncbi:MAG: sugar ABC transporter permease [Actinomycetota bacterium]|nr:sugar ABC transporter permease [Actinomycetota bacterium]
MTLQTMWLRVRQGYGWYLLPGLVLFVIVIGLPLIANIGLSFTQWRGVGSPTWIGVDNYTRLFGDDVFWTSFRNNLLLMISIVIIPTGLGLVVAATLYDYVAAKFGPRLSSLFRTGYYLPQLLPIAVAGVVWGWILHPQYGVLNSLLETVGLDSLTHNWLGDKSTALLSVMGVMVWFQLGYPIVIFMAALGRIDPELYEAAELDGASWFRRFRHITVPLIRPEMIVVLLTTTVHSLKVFAQVYVLTGGGPGNATNVPAYFAYQNFFEKAQVGYGASIANVLTVLIVGVMIVFLTAQNREERKAATR